MKQIICYFLGHDYKGQIEWTNSVPGFLLHSCWSIRCQRCFLQKEQRNLTLKEIKRMKLEH